jgi:hypothetical protein
MINQEDQEKNKIIVQLSDEQPILMSIQFSNCGYVDDQDLKLIMNEIASEQDLKLIMNEIASEFLSKANSFYYGPSSLQLNLTFYTYRCLKPDFIKKLQDRLSMLFKKDVIYDSMFIPIVYNNILPIYDTFKL